MAQFALAAVSVASTLGQVAAQTRSAEIEEQELKQQAELEKIKAGEEAIQRRERLIQALAQQNARVGAAGIGFAGTPQRIALEDVKEFEREDVKARKLSDIRRQTLKASAKDVRRTGRLRAGVSLLSGATDIATSGAFSGGRFGGGR